MVETYDLNLLIFFVNMNNNQDTGPTLIPIPISIDSDQLNQNKNEITIKVEEVLTIPKKIKIGIGIPSGKMIDTAFVRMLLERLFEWSQKHIIQIYINEVIPIDLSRNQIVENAKKEHCDYLFFVDSDIIIKEGQLDRLLSHNKDVTTGVYYKRIFPYEPLPRKKVTENLYIYIEPEDKEDNIENRTTTKTTESNEIIEIDGTGMGCFLVKMDIFDKISYPWFEFKYFNKNGKWGQNSEDLVFCQKLQDIGIKIYCDPFVKCPHIGATIDQSISRLYKEFRLNCIKELEKTTIELSEFTGMSVEEIYEKWEIATELVAKEYIAYKESSNSNFDPKEFYKSNKSYIFDLTNWHMAGRRGFDVNLVKNIKRDHPSATKILDFGSGCGQNAIELAEVGYDVAMADYDGHTSQFAKFRAKKRGLDIKFYDIEKPIDDKFDVILAFDVIEHIPDTEFKNTIALLKNLKKNGGKILTTVSFGSQGGLHPMHYDETSEKIALIEKLNSE